MINIDKSGSNSGAIRVYNKRALATKSRIKVRKCKYLNNIVYNNIGGTNVFVGDGTNYYAIEDSINANLLSARINSSGVILSIVTICP